ncbi:MAG: TetR/AcrR family transcriptional regulator [Solirubrobacteraceae bacterium]|nr:TetR/AcrR family transcriptional regulator [Solirubrobacteraceae bacterium]
MTDESLHARRSAATRRKLIEAATTLFAERGYAAVGTEEIVRTAGVTRGAMYHQFADKAALLEAMVEEAEKALVQRVAEGAIAQAGDPIAALKAGSRAFLDEVADPATRQILLIDAPSVLGHARWREIGLRHGLGLVEGVLAHGVELGVLRPMPVRAMAQLVSGAIDEAALAIASADDPVAARATFDEALDLLIEAFRV